MEFWPSIAVRKKSTLVLTEGTINSLACERAGAEYIGALGGSDPHPRQLLRLGGWGTIICATDGDAAGDKLAEYLRLNLSMSEVIRAPIPRGEDCDNLPRDVLIDVLSSAGYERTVQD